MRDDIVNTQHISEHWNFRLMTYEEVANVFGDTVEDIREWREHILRQHNLKSLI